MACSQKFMRTQKNECSFVSLRDIQRVLKIIHWFLNNGREIFNQMSRKKQKSSRKFSESLSEAKSAENVQTIEKRKVIEENTLERDESDENDDEENNSEQNESDEENQEYITGAESDTDTNEYQAEKLNFTTSIILALNTCYHVGLQSDVTRKEYREKVSEIFLANNHRINSEYILQN